MQGHEDRNSSIVVFFLSAEIKHTDLSNHLTKLVWEGSKSVILDRTSLLSSRSNQ